MAELDLVKNRAATIQIADDKSDLVSNPQDTITVYPVQNTQRTQVGGAFKVKVRGDLANARRDSDSGSMQAFVDLVKQIGDLDFDPFVELWQKEDKFGAGQADAPIEALVADFDDNERGGSRMYAEKNALLVVKKTAVNKEAGPQNALEVFKDKQVLIIEGEEEVSQSPTPTQAYQGMLVQGDEPKLQIEATQTPAMPVEPANSLDQLILSAPFEYSKN